MGNRTSFHWRRALAIGVIILACAPAFSDNKNNASQSVAIGSLHPRTLTAVDARVTSKTVRFHVADPLAKVSDAWLDDPSQAATGAAALSLAGGYQLTNRVVVRVRDEVVLRKVLNDYPDVVAKPILAKRGFWVVASQSIAEAAALAEDMTGRAGFEIVELDIKQPRSLRETPDDPFFHEQWHIRN